MRTPLLAASIVLWLALPALGGKPAPSRRPRPTTSGPRPAPIAPSAPAPATPAPAPVIPSSQPLRPNLFEVKSGTLSVSYATSGIDGKPHFNYQDSGVTISASDAQIRTQETEIGTLVTVTIRRTIDSGSAAFSLLVPLVNLDPARQTTAPALRRSAASRRPPASRRSWPSAIALEG